MKFVDTLTNLVAGLGAGNSKTPHDAFGLRQIGDQQLEAMYRSDWISRKVVDLPVEDMLRPWRAWQADKDTIEAIEDAEKRHQIRAKLALAMIWARLYGGSVMLFGADTALPSTELRLDRIGQGSLRYITVLPRRMLAVPELDYDPTSPFYGEPKYYTLNTKEGNGLQIHPSRVLRFIGAGRPDIDTNNLGWGDSILQVCYDAIHNAALTQAAAPELVHEAKLDVINVPNLGALLSTDQGTQTLMKRFSASNALKSINNTLLLDGAEVHDRKQMTFAGLSELMMSSMHIVAAASDIPATRFVGTAPKGLNATGEGDLRNYYDMLDGRRERDLRPALSFIDEILWRDALGAVPKDAYYMFNPLWQMSAKEKADIAFLKAQAAQIYAGLGLLPDEPLAKGIANMLVEDDIYPGLEIEIEKYLQTNGNELVSPDEMKQIEVQRAQLELQSAQNGGEQGNTPPAKDHITPHLLLPNPRNGIARRVEYLDEIDAFVGNRQRH